MRICKVTACLAATLLALAAHPGDSGAQTVLYGNAGAFTAASGATLQTDFESLPIGGLGNFTAGTLSFLSNGPQLYILPPFSTDSSPVPSSRALAGNGDEDFTVAFTSGTGHAIGFDATTNRYDMPTVQVLAENGSVLASFSAGIAPNQTGFVGIVSSIPFKGVRWVADRGYLQDAWIDNVRASASLATPASRSTWGRLKQLMR